MLKFEYHRLPSTCIIEAVNYFPFNTNETSKTVDGYQHAHAHAHPLKTEIKGPLSQNKN